MCTASSRVSVLIVDEDSGVRRVLSRALRQSCPVITARSADDALALLSHLEVESIISDLELGPASHDGIWLLGQVADRWPHIDRLLLTGAPTNRAFSAVAGGLARRLLTKPACLGQVEAALAERVDARRTVRGTHR